MELMCHVHPLGLNEDPQILKTSGVVNKKTTMWQLGFCKGPVTSKKCRDNCQSEPDLFKRKFNHSFPHTFLCNIIFDDIIDVMFNFF